MAGKTAIVLPTVDHHGDEIPVSPRTMLKRVVERATAMGFDAKAGSELEYYLLTDTYEQAWRKGYVGLERFGYYNEDYVLLQATKGEPIHGKLRNLMTQAGIPVEFSKGEAAPGQHEVNIRYDDVLEMADRTVLFKHGAKEIAYLNGFGLTFMAKPDHTWTGSSGHLHISLWDESGEQAAFFEEGAEPYGMSPTMRHFLGGMMKFARELAPFIAPNINSYKRYAVASWAPVNIVWGRDNRTTGFRIVGDGSGLHIENRFRRRHERVPRVRPCWALGCWASSARSSRRTSTTATATWPPAATACREHCTRQSRAREQRGGGRDLRGRCGGPLPQRGARGAGQYDAGVHPWDRERYLERS
jgi:glutamine synthetase